MTRTLYQQKIWRSTPRKESPAGMQRFLFAALGSLFFVLGHASAETLRVTTWNLQEARGSAATNGIEAAAKALKEIDPDVILLQQVRDWPMCLQLVEALKPAVYNVVVCSKFGQSASAGAGNGQAAILSKRKAYFSWSEAWRAQDGTKVSGGFVFAAIEANGYRVALFSVELDDQIQSSSTGSDPAIARVLAACRQQWGDGVGSFRKWVNNRPVSAVVAGALLGDQDRVPNEGEAVRFANEFLTAPLAAARPQTGQRFSVRLSASADALPGVVLSRSQQTCDLDLELVELPAISSTASDSPETKAAPLRPPAETLPLSTNVSVASRHAQTSSPSDRFYWLALTPAILLILGIFIWLLTRGGKVASKQLEADLPLRLDDSRVGMPGVGAGGSSDATQAISIRQDELLVWQKRALAAEQQAQRANDLISAGLISFMREWLKQKLFRRLIEDRAALLETQQAATFRALAVDERLSRIEKQLQQQNQAYEQRIEHLIQELRVTKEESRALIRAQIVQIKAEMDAARAKLLAEAEQHAVAE